MSIPRSSRDSPRRRLWTTEGEHGQDESGTAKHAGQVAQRGAPAARATGDERNRWHAHARHASIRAEGHAPDDVGHGKQSNHHGCARPGAHEPADGVGRRRIGTEKPGPSRPSDC